MDFFMSDEVGTQVVITKDMGNGGLRLEEKLIILDVIG